MNLKTVKSDVKKSKKTIVFFVLCAYAAFVTSAYTITKIVEGYYVAKEAYVWASHQEIHHIDNRYQAVITSPLPPDSLQVKK